MSHLFLNVCFDSYNKIQYHRLDGCETISHSSGGWKFRTRVTAGILVMPSLGHGLLASCCVLSEVEEVSEISGVSFIKVLIPP